MFYKYSVPLRWFWSQRRAWSRARRLDAKFGIPHTFRVFYSRAVCAYTVAAYDDPRVSFLAYSPECVVL